MRYDQGYNNCRGPLLESEPPHITNSSKQLISVEEHRGKDGKRYLMVEQVGQPDVLIDVENAVARVVRLKKKLPGVYFKVDHLVFVGKPFDLNNTFMPTGPNRCWTDIDLVVRAAADARAAANALTKSEKATLDALCADDR